GLMTPVGRIVDELLAIAFGEKVVVVHDRAHEDLGRAFEYATREKNAQVVRIDWEALVPKRPWTICPREVLNALRDANASVLAVSTEEGEYDARHALVSAVAIARTRHVHIIGTSRRALLGSMSGNTARVFELTETLRQHMRPTSKIAVRSSAGTQ